MEAPVAGYNGVVGGVTFYKGRAHVDEAENPAAVGYFRRRKYTLTEVREEEPEQAAKSGDAPVKPKQGDDKTTWVKYVVATTDLTEAEAKDLTKAELVKLADAEKEQS
ncbi:hypothetical protein [Nocardiopsis protaetiae]|uniref:hypothetical protein n=1 Tax=Nocardiopsis protaetiae TaxID=3382270 RepID=UPI00387A9B32